MYIISSVTCYDIDHVESKSSALMEDFGEDSAWQTVDKETVLSL